MASNINRVPWAEIQALKDPIAQFSSLRSAPGPVAVLCEAQEFAVASEWVRDAGLVGVGIVSKLEFIEGMRNWLPVGSGVTFTKSPKTADVGLEARNLAVCLVQSNDYEVTKRCILSLLTSGASLDQMVLLDNGSSDGSGARLWITFPELTMIRSPGQLPYCSAFNLCAAIGTSRGAENLLILNNDIFDFSPNFLENLHARISDEIAFASPVLLDCGSSKVLRGGAYPAFGFTHEFGTECFLVSSSVWLALGGFREEFEMYGEDLDLLFRAKKRFQAIGVFSEAASIRHDCGTNIQRAKLPNSRRYAIRMRNLIWLHRIYPSMATYSAVRTLANYLLASARGNRGLIALLWSLTGIARAVLSPYQPKESDQ